MKTQEKARSTTPAAFCAAFPWDREPEGLSERDPVLARMRAPFTVEWFNLEGIHPVGQSRIAKIALVTRGQHEHYQGFLVKIIHKINGPIDETYFGFDAFLDADAFLDVRCDGRGHSTAMPPFNGYYASPSGLPGTRGFGWWVYAPKDVNPICEAIRRYIKSFE